MNKQGYNLTAIDSSKLPKDILSFFISAAQEIKINRIAIVGGVVRDALFFNRLEYPMSKSKDIDLVIEGSANHLAKKVQNNLGSERVAILRENKNYKTVEMKVDGVLVDIASARKETYPIPGANPIVVLTNIEDDLKRRDFTINAIALDLTNYELIDPYKGRDAIAKKELDFLHSKSFEEDPTRVIRGARYASRLGLKVSQKSFNQIKSTLKNWPWHWVQGTSIKLAPPALATRLRMELEILFEKEHWEQSIQSLQEWGAVSLVDKSLQEDSQWKKRIENALELKINPLLAWIAGSKNAKDIAARLQLPIRQQKVLNESLQVKEFLSNIFLTKEYWDWTPAVWTFLIEDAKWQADSIGLAICQEITLYQPLLLWFKRWRLIKSPISAKDLIAQGWEPGPSIKRKLKELREKKLNEEDLRGLMS